MSVEFLLWKQERKIICISFLGIVFLLIKLSLLYLYMMIVLLNFAWELQDNIAILHWDKYVKIVDRMMYSCIWWYTSHYIYKLQITKYNHWQKFFNSVFAPPCLKFFRKHRYYTFFQILAKIVWYPSHMWLYV